MMKRRAILLLVNLLLLAACVRELPDTGPATDTAAATVVPTQTPLPPTATTEPPTPTATLAPVYIGELLAVSMPGQDALPFVFLVDMYTWQSNEIPSCPGCPPVLEFAHWDLAGCSFQVGADADLSVEETSTARFGTQDWQVESGLQGTRIHYYSVWLGQFRLDILANGTGNPACRADIEAVLAEAHLSWEMLAMRLPSGLPTPAPLPLPADYACESLPPRLQVGAAARVIADSIWVRSEPRRAGDTRILLLYKDMPIALIVNGGPVCSEGLTFWNVRYYAGSEYSGWIAESDSVEYYLEPLSP